MLQKHIIIIHINVVPKVYITKYVTHTDNLSMVQSIRIYVHSYMDST